VLAEIQAECEQSLSECSSAASWIECVNPLRRIGRGKSFAETVCQMCFRERLTDQSDAFRMSMRSGLTDLRSSAQPPPLRRMKETL
jgi:hypothetical protein